MFRLKNIVLTILAAVVFGALLGYRASLPFAWQRAVLAALAFGILGLVISYLSSRRK